LKENIFNIFAVIVTDAASLDVWRSASSEEWNNQLRLSLSWNISAYCGQRCPK